MSRKRIEREKRNKQNKEKIPEVTSIPASGIEEREHETAYYTTQYEHATSV